MRLPFTETSFLNVFAAYNSALWPAVMALWVVSALVVFRWWLRGRGGRDIHALLAVHWAWSGIAYHWIYFRRINPAAVLFAAVFVVQALIFAWLFLRKRDQFKTSRSFRGILSGCFLLYGFLYPFMGFLAGLEYPRMPLYAVPCPTTLLTAGMLPASSGLPRTAYVLPIVWAVIGGSAALFMDIRADYALLAAAALLVLDLVAPKALGGKA